MRGTLSTIIRGVSFTIMTLSEGWPLVRVATYKGTNVHLC